VKRMWPLRAIPKSPVNMAIQYMATQIRGTNVRSVCTFGKTLCSVNGDMPPFLLSRMIHRLQQAALRPSLVSFNPVLVNETRAQIRRDALKADGFGEE